MKGIRLVIDIEEVGHPDDLPEELRATYETFDAQDPERRQDIADCVTAAVGAGGGAFAYNGDVSDLFAWLCGNGYVSVSVEEDEDEKGGGICPETGVRDCPAEHSTLNAQRPKHTSITSDPDDSWAEVELWRWQYGTLPQPNDMRPLYVPAGLLAMAEAIQKGDPNNFPAAGNVIAALAYAARVIMKHAGEPETVKPEPETEGGAE